jgi:hypothetical protein
MFNQLDPEEVHAVLKSLGDLYVKGNRGHGDLSITIESETTDGELESVRGIVAALNEDAVTLGVGTRDTQHVEVPLAGVVRLVIER